MDWKFMDGMPIYTQIVDQLTASIASGAYKPGDRMPSVRDLATDAGVNPNTMQRALGELERRGILYTERTSGRFVTQDEKVLESLNKSIAEAHIRELFRKLRDAGMTDLEIKKQVAAFNDGQEGAE